MNKILIDERRKALLTETDRAVIQAIIQAELEGHKCQFSSEELQIVKSFVDIFKETRSMVVKGIVGFIFLLILVLFVLGLNHGLITVGKPIMKIGG